MTNAYYNENDEFAAAWLRNLIDARLIPKGEVDERSIEDVRPSDIREFTQCHFFAGIGVWAYALRLAEWPDDRKVWTGSCPCQPFSAAGKGGGFADERHLWPSWFHLIDECRPDTVFGEQVEAAIKGGWLDLVQDDLEGVGYGFGSCSFPACGVGAPHIRQRIYFVGVANAGYKSERRVPIKIEPCVSKNGGGPCATSKRPSNTDELAHSPESRRPEAREHDGRPLSLSARPSERGGIGELADASSERRQQIGGSSFSDEDTNGRKSNGDYVTSGDGTNSRLGESDSTRPLSRDEASSLNGHGNPSQPTSFWSPCNWLPCIDGKSRPVEPGTFPLAHGIASRVGRLRGYGNALVAPQAAEFVKAYLDICG